MAEADRQEDSDRGADARPQEDVWRFWLRPRFIALGALAALAMVGPEGFARYATWRVALIGLGVLVALGLSAVNAARPAPVVPWMSRWTLWLLAAGTMIANLKWRPLRGHPWSWRAPTLTGLGALGLHRGLGGLSEVRGASAPRGALIALSWLMVLGAAAYYAATIYLVPQPDIDVFDHLQRGGQALLAQFNPYTTPVPDYYGGKQPYGFATPGFPYPPQVVFVSALASLLGLDVRYLHLLALLVSALLVRRVVTRACRRSGGYHPAGDYLAASYLYIPRQAFIIKYAHTEPISGMLLAAAVHARSAGRHKLGALLWGLFVSSKQYLLVAAPLFGAALLPQPSQLALCVLGALLPWLPFIAWDAEGLWRAAFGVHLGRPARKDALTLNAWLLAHRHPIVAGWVAIALGAAVGLTHARASNRWPSVIPVAVACAAIVTVFFGPQGFSNYYALVAWCALAGLAAVIAEFIEAAGPHSS